jgi:hypothetical protein
MSIERERLFALIKQRLPKNVSLIEEIADVLDISYDAMYRRLNGKTVLSFSEAITLAKHFRISINNLYNKEDEENLFVLKRSNNDSLKGLDTYFNTITKAANFLTKFESAELLFAAKDIPIYYLPENSLYTKFKLFIFSNLHTDQDTEEKIKFKLKDFNVSEGLISSAKGVINAYENTSATEIWNDTTIDSTLYQIYYFHELRFIDKEEANQLCTDLEGIIKKIERQAIYCYKEGSQKRKYNLYYNKLIGLNNTVLFRTEKLKTLVVPYTALSYLRIDDPKTCNEVAAYFSKQLKYSKKICGPAEVERQLFFTAMYEKIEQLKKQIAVKSIISFM